MKTLKHPNIVSYKESFTEEDYINIVMQFCEGGDLYKKIRNCSKKIPEKTVLNFTAQIILAVHFLHDRKILHRDLKTQNIFLSKERLFVGDFGISKTLENTRELANTYIGTPYYMSPELFNYNPYSYKSDIWSLGCVLYEICNLKHAFNAQTINGLAMKILKGNFIPVSKFYSKQLRDFISSLLVTDPRMRPCIKKITQDEFVQQLLVDYLIELCENEQLSEWHVDSLRLQVKKIGLTSLIKQKTQNENIRKLLLSNRETICVKKELIHLRELKELELKKELEKKKKLESEIEKLGNICKEFNNAENVFKKKNESEIEEDIFKDDFEDFEFGEDIEECKISQKMVLTKISEYNQELKSNQVLIQKIKNEIKITVENLNQVSNEKNQTNYKEIEIKQEEQKSHSNKKENIQINQKDIKFQEEVNIFKDPFEENLPLRAVIKRQKSDEIPSDPSDENSLKNEESRISNFSSKHSESNLSNKYEKDMFYDTNEFQEIEPQLNHTKFENTKNFEDFTIVNILKEKLKDLGDKIFKGLGKNSFDQINNLVNDIKVEKNDIFFQNILDLIGKDNIGYCHLIEQYIYFSQELEQLKINN